MHFNSKLLLTYYLQEIIPILKSKIRKFYNKIRKGHLKLIFRSIKMSLLLPGMKAPNFHAMGFQAGFFDDFSLDKLLTHNAWAVLLFYPLDFGHIAASELLEMEKAKNKLKFSISLNCR